MKKVIFCSLILAVMLGASTGLTAEAAPYSVFNRSQPETLRRLTVSELEKDWYTLQATYGQGMFNPVFLPFSYHCEEGAGDPNQTLTFPALLSFKFDFVPDNYSARHPGFIYRRDPRALRLTATEREGIVAYIKRWTATHAVAGELIESKAGYKGRIKVFDVQGEEIFAQEYLTPVPYFTLMGQMVLDWFNFREIPVSTGLTEELFRPMTSALETVQWYGESFQVEWRSQAEWVIYEKILARDPLFSEVQFWYANQRGWETDDSSWAHISRGKALQGHLVIPALWEFSPAHCPDEALNANYLKVLNYAGEIMAEDPRVKSSRIDAEGDQLSVAELNSFVDIALKYPCYHPLPKEMTGRSLYICQRSIPVFWLGPAVMSMNWVD